jgi:hypothetical protein
MKPLLMRQALPEQLNAAIPPSAMVTGELPPLPLSGASAAEAFEDIRVRAETVSTLLKEIVNERTTRHWGINE